MGKYLVIHQRVLILTSSIKGIIVGIYHEYEEDIPRYAVKYINNMNDKMENWFTSKELQVL